MKERRILYLSDAGYGSHYLLALLRLLVEKILG